jgi:spermidine synthase
MKSKYEIIMITMLLAFCSIVYELLLSNTLAIVTGSYIWWQSLTIGIFIGGLGLGAFYSEKVTNTFKTLMSIEIGLAFLGAISVVTIYLFHATFKYFDSLLFYTNGDFYSSAYVQGNFLAKILFFFIVESLTLGVGFLSGYEIPLLMKMSELLNKDGDENEHRVLAFNYLGTLVGTIVFAYWLLPKLDVVKTSVFVAFLNLLVCVYFLIKYVKNNYRFFGSLIFSVFILVSLIGMNQELITQRYLKFFYYLPKILGKNNVDLHDFVRRLDDLQPIERTKSLYQYVDIFKFPYTEDNKNLDATILTLDTNFQFSTATEYYYHQSFAHIPIAINKKVPENILVLGGGDGLLIRELIKYSEVKSIHHIELDQKMIELANGRFSALNENSLKDPRVHVEINDGFYYLRNTKDKYDAIYIDFPYPNSYDLAKLYSVEFYKFVARALSPEGFVVFDTPFYIREESKGNFGVPSMSHVFNDRHLVNNSIFASTVYYAGFKTMLPYKVADESFLYLKKEPGEIDFGFLNNRKIRFINDQTRREMQEMRNQNFPYNISLKYVNSIFKPTISRKEDF